MTDPHQVSQNPLGYHPSSSCLILGARKDGLCPSLQRPWEAFLGGSGWEQGPAVLLRSKAGGSPAGGQYLSRQGPDYEICKYQKSILGFCLAYARKSLRRCLLRTHRQVDLEWPQMELS